MTATASFADLPPIILKVEPSLTEVDVVTAPVLAVEDGIGGTYVLVGSKADAEVVDRSEVRLVDSVATTLPQI